MTKKEIVKDIADKVGLTQLACKEIVQMVFDAIVQTLVDSEDHRIELRNFGVFEVKRRKARRARNPRTGDPVDVPARSVVIFKPGKKMEELVAHIEDVPVLSGDEDAGFSETDDDATLAEPVGAGGRSRR